MPSWGPEPGRPPPERTLIMSVGGRGGVRVGKTQFQHALGRNPGILALDPPLPSPSFCRLQGQVGAKVTLGGQVF